MKKLGFKQKSGISPGLKQACLILAANESFEHSEKDLKMLTGVFVSKSRIHRIAQEEETEEYEPEEEVSEICLDGGSMPMRRGEFQQFKTSRVNKKWHFAKFKEDEKLVNKLQSLNLGKPVSLLGDGHDGVWNVFDELVCERREILDWYHLMENLHKQDIGKDKLEEVREQLWKGEKDKAIQEFKLENNFRKYLEKHYHRLVNYEYYQSEGLTIGSGAVESSVKQIKARTGISGARWSENGARNILSLRTHYLNGRFHKTTKSLSRKASCC